MCRSAPKRGERSLLLAGLWRRTTFSKPWRDLEIVSNAERSANSKHLKSAGWLLTHFTTLPPSPTSHLLQSGCLVIIKQILWPWMNWHLSAAPSLPGPSSPAPPPLTALPLHLSREGPQLPLHLSLLLAPNSWAPRPQVWRRLKIASDVLSICHYMWYYWLLFLCC